MIPSAQPLRSTGRLRRPSTRRSQIACDSRTPRIQDSPCGSRRLLGASFARTHKQRSSLVYAATAAHDPQPCEQSPSRYAPFVAPVMRGVGRLDDVEPMTTPVFADLLMVAAVAAPARDDAPHGQLARYRQEPPAVDSDSTEPASNIGPDARPGSGLHDGIPFSRPASGRALAASEPVMPQLARIAVVLRRWARQAAVTAHSELRSPRTPLEQSDHAANHGSEATPCPPPR
jgi:hypothetical protein